MSKPIVQHLFSQVPQADLERSVFNRSFEHKTAFDAGWLVPVLVQEVYPGDTMHLKANIFIRLTNPTKVPYMDNLYVDTFYFAVPNRILWNHWVNFMGEKKNPTDSTVYTIPQVVASGPNVAGCAFVAESLFDYMGIPINVNGLSVNSLPCRAYNQICNHWFRNQNLQNSSEDRYEYDGPDDKTMFPLVARCKQGDYFTSALPWPQKGPGVMMPIGDSAPVFGNDRTLGITDGSALKGLRSSSTNFLLEASSDAYGTHPGTGSASGTGFGGHQLLGIIRKDLLSSSDYSKTGLYADLSTATAPTINALRTAFALQRLQERDARGGTRYKEILRAHWNVTSPDERMMWPEFLGSSSQRIGVNPVQQTSSTDATTPQAHLAAYSVGADTRGGFTKSFVEHCYVIGIINVRGQATYQRGLNRMWSRLTKYDFYWPALAHIGEVAVLNKEIYCQGPGILEDGHPIDDMVFGYQEPWGDLRYSPSLITGKLRSVTGASNHDSLDVWHLSQKFDDLPALADVIVENPPIGRVSAVQNEPKFVADMFFEIKHARELPTYGVPGMLDHF